MDKIKYYLPINKIKEDPQLKEAAKLLIKLSKKAGKMALSYWNRLSTLQVEWKAAKDWVSEADRNIELTLRAMIKKAFPSHGIIGEEFEKIDGVECSWIIDPIDGTTSFVRGQWHFCTSIAFARNGKLLMGAVTSPALNEFYGAIIGCGAYLNGKKINVGNRKTLAESVFSTGYACIRNGQKENNLLYYPTLMQKMMATRRYGSAALDCCYLAKGIVDGYWEFGLNLYDVAAGSVIAFEAGAKVLDFDGSDAIKGKAEHYPKEILVANPTICDLFLKEFRQIRNKLQNGLD